MNQPIRSRTSTDGSLTLEVFEEDECYIGFSDQAWHTHGDLLVPEYGMAPLEAVIAFFESVVNDHGVICIFPQRPSHLQVSVTDDPDTEITLAAGEPLVLRLWSGKLVTGTARA
ncbi:hypothetical protein [Pseudoxanthomonas sacheonensis]|uniref:Uncharacterized protein n=1 Tax=Pseudoxanthomonas sacheonensis TaxID=443615 RepID=A0ABU1RR13_9GAMM|nr:hypothetical protein [Pseudoxanthomonas sacheonensis]MDR6841191.1 hypothetical protein [Pseudoxanthomonas sacheonensis]